MHTGHGRDVRRDTALSLYFCELEGRSEFEEGVTAEESTDEDAVGFECFSDLDEDTCGADNVSFLPRQIERILRQKRVTWKIIHPM